MKKKFIIAGITCSFLLISGVCYSCSYHDRNTSAVLVDSLASKETVEQGEENPIVENNTLDSSISVGIDQGKETADNSSLAGVDSVNGKGSNKDASGDLKAVIYVHICGAVKKPGVYSVDSGARIFDLIELSGGLNTEAAGDYINQAQQVTDGQRIYIPTKEEVKALSAANYITGDQSIGNPSTTDQSAQSSNATTELININTATAEELMSLPGIGQAKADSIISYRSTNGKFQTIEDLMNIPGIKEGLFSKVSAYIKVK